MITVRCKFCGENQQLRVTIDMLQDVYCGMAIKEAMPHLDREQRELLISRTCERCYSRLFGKEELYGLGR